MTDCLFLYFKPQGKWKYEGRGKFPTYPENGWRELNRNAIIKENGSMPGITGNASDLIVVLIPDDDCKQPMAYPQMLLPEAIV